MKISKVEAPVVPPRLMARVLDTGITGPQAGVQTGKLAIGTVLVAVDGTPTLGSVETLPVIASSSVTVAFPEPIET